MLHLLMCHLLLTTTYELNMDYDDFNDFLIVVNNIQGSSGSGSENLDVKFKMDGVLDNW